MAGNFAIGCGVMVAAGSLNDLVRALEVSVALGGQLIAVAALRTTDRFDGGSARKLGRSSWPIAALASGK